jgi:hypothetical protein
MEPVLVKNNFTSRVGEYRPLLDFIPTNSYNININA